MHPEALASPFANLDQPEPLETPQATARLEIKRLEVTPKGIRIKYERFNQARKEEGLYPKKGEVSSLYNENIHLNLSLIAQSLLGICGLQPDVWDNEHLKLERLNFFDDQQKNGLIAIAISGKIKGRNELLGLNQSFSVPKISSDVIIENNLKLAVSQLLEDLQGFYHGDTKYQQTSLFETGA